jgi:hypothetical protein
VAGNPNTPPHLLAILGRTFPDALAGNAILDWMLLEDANWLGGFDAVARQRLLMEPAAGVGLLWWAARFGSADDKLALTQNPTCPAELLAYISGIGVPDLTASVSAHIHSAGAVPPSTDDNAATADDGTNPNPGSLTLGAGSGSNRTADIAALVGFGAVPSTVYPYLIDGDVHVRRAVARADDAPPAVIHALLVDDDEDTRAMARSHRGCSPDLLRTLERVERVDPDADVSALADLPLTPSFELTLARHPNTDPSLLRKMTASSNWRLREAVATNPALSVETLVLIASDFDAVVLQPAEEEVG